MIYKTNVTDKTVCIGSFAADAEIAGQFQYTGKKGNVYMFYVSAVTDAGVTIANVVTGESSIVPFGSVKKIKALEGAIVSTSKYAPVDRVEVINTIVSGDDYACLNVDLSEIKVIGMSMVNKQAKFMIDESTEYPVESMYKFVETIQFGS